MTARAAIVAAALAAAGCGSGYSIGVTVEPGCAARAARLTLDARAMPGSWTSMQTVDAASFFAAGGRVVIIPPDGATSVTLTATALDAGGGTITSGAVVVTIDGHQLAEVTLAFDCAGDGGAVDQGGDGGCLGDEQCPLGQVCKTGRCQPGCSAGHGCGDAGACMLDAGTCFSCKSDPDCGGATPRCNLATGLCVPCLPQMDNCTAGSHCIPMNGGYTCALGCKGDPDCQSADGGGASFRCCNSVCVDTASDRANCTGCGLACPNTESCCALCVDTTSSPANCGGCGVVCNLPNAQSSCSASQCVVTGCSAGYMNCDGLNVNGCETYVLTDPGHCGACNAACSGNNVTALCSGGQCVGPCDPLWGDCNGDRRGDGCEHNLSNDPSNCGACGKVCSSVNGTPSCAGGVCKIACNAGFGDCNGNVADGCEANLSADAKNCGGCNMACASNVCSSSQCAKRVFVTSNYFTGMLGGLAGADAACQMFANSVPLGGTFKAWMSDSITSANARLTHSTGPYTLVDGTLVAASYAALTSGTLQHPINLTEHGGPPPVGNATCKGGAATWTNTSANGNNNPLNGTQCNNWNDGTANYNGVGGDAQFADSLWSYTGCITPCSFFAALTCIEQ